MIQIRNTTQEEEKRRNYATGKTFSKAKWQNEDKFDLNPPLIIHLSSLCIPFSSLISFLMVPLLFFSSVFFVLRLLLLFSSSSSSCFCFCFCFWAAAPKGSMTYAFTHMGNFLLLRTPPSPQPPGPYLSLEAHIPASRPKSQS